MRLSADDRAFLDRVASYLVEDGVTGRPSRADVERGMRAVLDRDADLLAMACGNSLAAVELRSALARRVWEELG